MSIDQSNAPSESSNRSKTPRSGFVPVPMPIDPRYRRNTKRQNMNDNDSTVPPKLSELESVLKTTSAVTAREARTMRVGRINCSLKFQNGIEQPNWSVTGTLIHERLVLTCAHFLNKEYLGVFSADIYVTENSKINHGIELNIDPNSDGLIVKNILNSSPFKNSDLQIGDVIKKVSFKSINPQYIINEYDTDGEIVITAHELQNNLNNFSILTKINRHMTLELHILRHGVKYLHLIC